MIVELGHLALWLALGVALLQATLPLAGAWRGEPRWMALAHSAVRAQALLVLLAFAALVYAFLARDFSVAYVAAHANSATPWYYRLSAVWAAHEGSLLLWVLILAGWSLAVSLRARGLPAELSARILAVLGLVSAGFLAFVGATSNPFERRLPLAPADGADLNPLLQDFGLIVHPPLLYMGYVGFSVAFAFAVAALLEGRLDAAWARWVRPWTLAAWGFLTVGIALGSWWAYYELGWGGWWFWDPVENASLMPWLAGTALVHSLAVTEKRGLFGRWTLLLAIATFSLSLLGTFLVRSGVLTSVHAFAADPGRGLYILLFMLVVVGGALALFALRAPGRVPGGRFTLASRETLLLVNNLVMVTACATILLGTLYPLLVDALAGASLSVGPPYFDAFFVPLMALALAALGIGVLARWRRTPGRWLLGMLAPVLATSASLGLLAAFVLGEWRWAAFAVCLLGAWVLLAGLRDLADKLRHLGLARGLRSLGAAYWGMQLAHAGLAICAIGAVVTSQFGAARDVRLAVGEHFDLGGYHFHLAALAPVQGPNFTAQRARIEVRRAGQAVATLYPEKRTYTVPGSVMTEAAIDAGLLRDLYVALGERLDDGSWAVRLQVKPLVRWIWLGALLIAAGALLAALDGRYRPGTRRRAEAT